MLSYGEHLSRGIITGIRQIQVFALGIPYLDYEAWENRNELFYPFWDYKIGEKKTGGKDRKLLLIYSKNAFFTLEKKIYNQRENISFSMNFPQGIINTKISSTNNIIPNGIENQNCTDFVYIKFIQIW